MYSYFQYIHLYTFLASFIFVFLTYIVKEGVTAIRTVLSDLGNNYLQSELCANLVSLVSVSDVGKSSLLLRFADNSFSGELRQLCVFHMPSYFSSQC